MGTRTPKRDKSPANDPRPSTARGRDEPVSSDESRVQRPEGWYRDPQGRLCYGDRCIDITLDPNTGIELKAKPDCDEPIVEDLFKAGLRGTYITQHKPEEKK